MNLTAKQTESHAANEPQSSGRIRLEDLMQEMREIEIDHGGKIYRLRLTQSNKLILTA